ncbi:hypothetical protein [Planomicrobium okeanokoites]|uniref:Uncharacterized protein n=1 Tax=Planomicrobium okeanokoites TaxID=244 RepID=A0ABV7KTG1_PLAOK|nr:hypothetical protein [Planomicrobium okeanokoites]TAA71609.1 hypothetical protein D2910_04845 [Planomicrobium okeanokoites]
MKKKVAELKIGDQVQLFTKLIPVPVPYEVILIEVWRDTNTVSGLHLKNPDGDKKMFSFLDGDLEMTMWTGYDVGSSYTENNKCAHCGNTVNGKGATV